MIELARKVADNRGAVFVLMNNAGVGSGGCLFIEPVPSDEVLGVNLLGVHDYVQARAAS